MFLLDESDKYESVQHFVVWLIYVVYSLSSIASKEKLWNRKSLDGFRQDLFGKLNWASLGQPEPKRLAMHLGRLQTFPYHHNGVSIVHSSLRSALRLAFFLFIDPFPSALSVAEFLNIYILLELHFVDLFGLDGWRWSW